MCIPLERVSSCMCGTAPKRSRPRPRGASVYWHETRDVRFSDIEVKPSRLHVYCFQAEDGIRDRYVTGVQTCALPICRTPSPHNASLGYRRSTSAPASRGLSAAAPALHCARRARVDDTSGESLPATTSTTCSTPRSEERRVGDEGNAMVVSYQY